MLYTYNFAASLDKIDLMQIHVDHMTFRDICVTTAKGSSPGFPNK